jgi:hypothetical protein
MFKDFTIHNYDSILDLAQQYFTFISYSEIKSNQRFLLWRHDIDCSPHRALHLAKIEYKRNIKSTYFIWLHSPMYNFFEKEVVNILNSIIDYGHDIGLHFDLGFYGFLTEEKIEKMIEWECQILENFLKQPISVFSHHNPNPDVLNYSDLTIHELAQRFPHYFKDIIAERINTYGTYFRDNVCYCSDSNGYWRFQNLKDLLLSTPDKIPRLQVLTHPEWWTEDALSPRERILRCINGRAEKTINNYDKALADMNRKNVR